MKNVLEYLEKSAADFPKKTAVMEGNAAFNYETLLCMSRKVGSGLSKKTEGQLPIPVFMEKGIHTLCAFFGTVYAGCFYVLLNPELPETRLLQILKVLDVPWLVTDKAHLEQARRLMPDGVLLLEDLENSSVDENLLFQIRQEMIDTDPLYANFTSGSTGVPKGVLVSHRSVIDFIDIFTELFGIHSDDIIGNQAPFDFDVSVKDIYSALKTGAALVIIPRAFFSLPAKLLDELCEKQVTTMIWAVSALCLISTFHGLDYRIPDSVKRILFSGEVMPLKHLHNWMEHLPNTEFINLYGPTEITCNCTYHRISREREYESGIPIGYSFPNEQVFLLDEQGEKITEPEICGEICVRGTALALGYYQDFEQTQQKFVQNPSNTRFYDRIYRTGDIGCFNRSGELYFKGRRDFQIKYMGHRIELEEIEAAMMEFSGVERSCCLFDEKRGRLYGFYVGTSEQNDLHHALSQKLPAFMIPGLLTKLEQMPLTKNGKIDRKALLAMTERRKRTHGKTTC